MDNYDEAFGDSFSTERSAEENKQLLIVGQHG